MRIFRPLRLLLAALLFSLIPASSFAGIFISVGFAPPILPEYDQPPCPEPGLMWTPGYWAYGEDGYYWVPGTWVPAPYEGALWTPPYWGWSDGLYVFHEGYWGPHVGYYGGVNYGFGYMGVGFAGGMWRGRDFVYNTAVVRVDERVVHTTYIDRTIVERNTIVNDRHVAFSGGPGGIRHDPAPEERFADRDHHVMATSFQHAHESTAMSDRSSYVKNNGGHPANAAVQRPWSGGAPAAGRTQQNQGGGENQGRGNFHGNPSGNNNNPSGNYNNNPSNRGNGAAPQYRPAPQQQPQQQNRPAPPQQQQYRPAPQPQQQNRPAPQPQQHAAPPPQQHEQHGGPPQRNEEKDHQH